jgi:xylulokinase
MARGRATLSQPMKPEYLLAIDLGTSGVKAGAFDLEGEIIGSAKEVFPTKSPRPGHVEQNPQDWWTACIQAIRQVAPRGSRCHAICVTGMAPTLICMDERGQVLMPSPIWRDRRDVLEQSEISAAVNQPRVDKALSWLLWCKRIEPAIYRQTRWILQSYEYLGFRLTGNVAATALDHQTNQSFRRAVERADLDVDKLPPRVLLPGEPVCGLSAEVAADLGLDRGVPVIAGALDAFVSWIGTATFRKGQACNTAGTTNSLGVVCDRPLVDAQRRIGSLPNILTGAWVLAGATSTGSNVIDWLIRAFYGSEDGAMNRLFAEAFTVDAGADGLIALPYLDGERAPLHDANARGVFFGVTGKHGRPHFARAVVESVAFAVRDVMAVMEEAGAAIDEIRVAGPAGQNLGWSQIRADVLGKPVVIPEVAESGLLGAAMIAGRSVGAFADLETAAERMIRCRVRLEPNAESHARYNRVFAIYRDLYRHLQEDFARLNESVNT